MQCSKCQATIAAGAKFCPKCGARAGTPAVEVGGKRCPQCGTENLASAKFCKKDGYRFDAVPASTAVSPPNEPRTQEAVSKPIPVASDSVTCPKCGTANALTARFCKKDGYPLQAIGAMPSSITTPKSSTPAIPLAMDSGISPTTPPVATLLGEPWVKEAVSKPIPPADDSVKCPKCGAANLSTAKFCRKDGHPLQAAGAVTPPVAVQPVVPPAKPAAMDSPVTTLAPKLAPQPVPATQPASVAPRPAVSAASRAQVIKPAAAKSRKGMIISAAVGAAILASTGGGYAYWAGYVGNRQGSVQNEINAELGSHGLSNIKVTVNHEWVASLAGTVLNQSDKDQAFGLVSGHKELKSIVNEVQIESNAADVEQSLRKLLAEAGLGALTSDVDEEFIATLSGTLPSDKEKINATMIAKSVAGVKAVVDQMVVVNMSEAPDTESVQHDFDDRMSHLLGAGSSRPYLSIEELYALRRSAGIDDPSTANTDVHNALIAAMRNTRDALNQQQIQQIIKMHSAAAPPSQALPPLPVVSPSASQRTADKMALDRELNARLSANGVSGVTGHVNPDMSVVLSGTVRSEDERYRALTIGGSLPGANGVRESIQIAAPQVAKLAPPQAAPQVPPQAAEIDPAKLEGDINRALRSRDINSVMAQVNDDMTLTLKGSVSAAEKERALQLARQVRGIRGIKDKIFVIE